MRLGEVNDRRAVSCGLQNEKYLRRLAFRIDRFGQWLNATVALSFLKMLKLFLPIRPSGLPTVLQARSDPCSPCKS